jgi:hypothetical protein
MKSIMLEFDCEKKLENIIEFGLPHPSIVDFFRCMCTHPIDPMVIHFLRYVHGNECMEIHDAICDIFATIVRDVGFHVEQANPQFCATQRFIVLDIAQPKEKNYPINTPLINFSF